MQGCTLERQLMRIYLYTGTKLLNQLFPFIIIFRCCLNVDRIPIDQVPLQITLKANQVSSKVFSNVLGNIKVWLYVVHEFACVAFLSNTRGDYNTKGHTGPTDWKYQKESVNSSSSKRKYIKFIFTCMYIALLETAQKRHRFVDTVLRASIVCYIHNYCHRYYRE